DGNVARVLARLDAIEGGLRENGRWQSLQQSADALLDPKSPSDWNEAMMELGAMICTPRAPRCLLCPVAEFCSARQLGLTEAIPEKRKKRATVEITLAAAVFFDPSGRTLLLPPPHKTAKHATHEDVTPLISKMWHFPTIVVCEDGAAELEQFLARFGALPASKTKPALEPLARARHTVTYRAIKLLPYLVRVSRLARIPG